MSCGIGHRCGSDLALLWLWHRPAATAPIRLQAWKPPYATGAALKGHTHTQRVQRPISKGGSVNGLECHSNFVDVTIS